MDAYFPRWEAKLRRAVSEGVQERAGCMLGFSRTIQDPDQTQVEASEDELEIVQRCFRELFEPLMGEPVLLTRDLSFPHAGALADLSAHLPGLLPETTLDFRERNQCFAILPEGFRLGDRSTEFCDTIVSEAESEIRHTYRKFPKTPGHFAFSRPGWNFERNQALIVVFRHDGLHSRSRPQDDPLQSSYFSAICFLVHEGGAWRLKGFANWMNLIQPPNFEEMKYLVAQRMSQSLAEAGWEVQESQEQRLCLRSSSGEFVTVVARDFLSDLLIGRVNEEPKTEFFTSTDPVLIVPHLDSRFILERLR